MDTRTARRVAEKAARDLMNNRAGLIGDLGVVHAERARLAHDVHAAGARGQQLIVAAQTEAARLVAAAQDLAHDGEQRYTDAYSAATAAGWTAADLAALSFQPTATPRRRRAGQEQPEPAPDSAPNTAVAAAPALPHQFLEHDAQRAPDTAVII